jgi:AcrR family transcriptional regulator
VLCYVKEMVTTRRATKARVPATDAELTQTQQRLLTAALEVFSEKGFVGASTAEIAAEAGVAEKTLFAHFGTKQELFLRTLTPSVITLIEPALVDGIRQSIQPGLSLRETLTALVLNRLAIIKNHPKRFKLVLQELLLRPDLRASYASMARERVLPHVVPVFVDLMSRGELRSDLPLPVLLRTAASLVGGYALARYVLDVPGAYSDDEQKDVADLVDLIARALSPSEPAALAPNTPPKQSRRRKR